MNADDAAAVDQKRQLAASARRQAEHVAEDEAAYKLRRDAEKLTFEAGLEEYENGHGRSRFHDAKPGYGRRGSHAHG